MHGDIALAKSRKPKEIVSLQIVLERVQVGDDPKIADVPDLGSTVVIEDGKPYTKVTSLKNDPIGLMHKRGQLGKRGAPETDARLKGARRYQLLSEIAEIGGARAIDPTREAVDGGRFQMPDTDKRLRAQDDLARIDRHIGERRKGLLRLILVHKYEITDLALSEPSRRAAVRECRDTLTMVAQFCGYEGKARPARLIHDDHYAMARYADDPAVHRAMHRIRRRM